jgi:hypothetical protein
MVINHTAHGLAANDMVIVRNTNVAAFNAYISSVTTDSFTVSCPNSGATSGSTGAYSCGIGWAHNSSTPGQINAGVASFPSNGEKVDLLSVRMYFATNTRQTTTYTITLPSFSLAGANSGFDNWLPPVDKVRNASTASPSPVSSTLAAIAVGADWNVFQLGALGAVSNPIMIMLHW